MQKKIVIVSKFFKPDITPRAFRTFELARELGKQGHDVKVLVPVAYQDKYHKEADHQFEVLPLIKEWKQLQGRNPAIKILRFILNHFLIVPNIYHLWSVPRGLKKLDWSKIDGIISIAYPFTIHFGVSRFLRKTNSKTPWIADCGDPFYKNKEARLPNPFYFSYLESKYLKRCNAITIPTTNSIHAYPRQLQSKIHIIPQGFNFDEISKYKNTDHQNDILTFIYAGNFSANIRDPRPFLECLATDFKDQNFTFHIYTRPILDLSEYQKKLGSKLIIHPLIPRNELLKELSRADFVVNFENKHSTQVPSKLIDYGILEKPILSVKPFDLNIELISEFLSKEYKNSLVIGDLNSFNITLVAENFMKHLSKLKH